MFVYLVQGESSSIVSYLYLKNRPSSDVLFLTYDKPVDGCIFFPNSTWAEGRNKLLEEARQGHEYLYYIFLDDDIEFIKGGFDEFEKLLLEQNPAAAMPVFTPKTEDSVLGFGLSYLSGLFYMPYKWQVATYGDAQMLALHKDVVDDELVVPYQVKFDKVSWWFTSSTQQILLFNIYGNHVLQANDVSVSNAMHREYTNAVFMDQQKEWLLKQFRSNYMDERAYSINIFSLKALARIFARKIRNRGVSIKSCFKWFYNVLRNTREYRCKDSYLLGHLKASELLLDESDLMRQYVSRTK